MTPRPPGRPKGYTTEAILLTATGSELIGAITCTHLHQITTESWSHLKQTIAMDLKGTIQWKSPDGHLYECLWDRSVLWRPETVWYGWKL